MEVTFYSVTYNILIYFFIWYNSKYSLKIAYKNLIIFDKASWEKNV